MNITVSRYPIPSDEERAALEAEHPGCHWPADRWEGYIQPDQTAIEPDQNWIVFVGVDHRPVVFLHRDKNGGVIT